MENAGLFNIGFDGGTTYSTIIEPFFSRSIGLDASGSPLNINGGAKLVYRSQKESFGTLYINQRGNDVYGPANFLVSRYSRNIGAQNRIGVLFSVKDQQNNGRNFTSSVDGFFRFGQRLSWSSFLSATHTDKSSTNGIAGFSRFKYISNTLSAWYNQTIITRTYDPQMGFVSRSNTLVTDPGIQYEIRRPWLPAAVRSLSPAVSLTLYHNATNYNLTDRYLTLTPVQVLFQDGGMFLYSAVLTKQLLHVSFKPLGLNISPGRYAYTRHHFSYTSDLSKKISTELSYDFGSYYNGRYNFATAAVSFAPIPYVYISPKVQIGKLSHVGYLDESSDVLLLSVEQRLALNPRVQLSGVYQRSNIGNTQGWNARFSWEFKPLSFFYLVYNSNSFDESFTSKPSVIMTRQLIAKISYLKQF